MSKNDPYFSIPERIIEKIKEQMDSVEEGFSKRYDRDINFGPLPHEDRYTGGLAESLNDKVKGNADGVSWSIDHRHLPQLEENKIGGDILITVGLEDRKSLKTKSLLLQFKKHSNKDHFLAEKQARDMISTGIDSRFGVFTSQGIDIYKSSEVVKNSGRFTSLKSNSKFSDLVGSDILRCYAGTPNLALDKSGVRFNFPIEQYILAAQFIPNYFIRLLVKINGR